MLIRRYFQDDLKTSAYLNAVVRIISVAILVTAVAAIWPGKWSQQQLNVFAFMVGIFPQIALKAIENLLQIPLRTLIPSLQQDYPLSDLDGLNIWYESRLLEEGIEDMQNLATANLVDVILRTRVPVERLVDWVDQAILYLRVRGREDRRVVRIRRHHRSDNSIDDRARLRHLGIRTATDLEDAFHPVLGADGSLSDAQKKQIEGLRWVLNTSGKGGRVVSVTETILATFQREPNLYHVRAWKAYWEPGSAGTAAQSRTSAGRTRRNMRLEPDGGGAS